MIRIFDCGKEWLDRYFITIENKAFSMSINPLDENGINLHCCCDDTLSYKGKGELVQIKDVPQDVQYAIANRIKEMIDERYGGSALYTLQTYGKK